PCKYATRLRYIPKRHAKIRIGALFSKSNSLLIPVFYQQPTVQNVGDLKFKKRKNYSLYQ
ncbi:MAG: hypothetical protein KAY95_00640, partial [Kaistella sp.]|nr:hypothetical protein [Kaistella sp.]